MTSRHSNAWTWNDIRIWPVLRCYFTENMWVRCWIYHFKTLAFFSIWNLKVHNCAVNVAYKNRWSVHFNTWNRTGLYPCLELITSSWSQLITMVELEMAFSFDPYWHIISQKMRVCIIECTSLRLCFLLLQLESTKL